MFARLTAVLLVLFCVSLIASAAQEENIPLFNGKNLDGWKVIGDGKWTVKDGVLLAKKDKAGGHGFLVAEKTYGDFVLTVEFQCQKGDSGIYFRAKPVETEILLDGLQAQVHPKTDVGGIYEFGGRGWVSKPDPKLIETAYKPGEWNTMVVKAAGGNITTTLNGHTISQLKNDPVRKEGLIALQLHGNQEMDVRFRKVVLSNP